MDFDSPGRESDDRRLAADRRAPTRTDPAIAQLSTSIGGPVGLHAGVGRSAHWTPLRVVFLMALVVLSFSWFGKAGCLQQTPVADSPGQMRLDWDDQRQFTGLCYSSVIAGYTENRLTPGDLADGALPFRTFWMIDDHKQYIGVPVLTGAFMYVSAQAARGWGALTEALGLPRALDAVNYFNIVALLLAFAWLTTLWASMRARRRDPWLIALMAISPLILVHAFTAYELLPVMLTALAMYAWSRDRVVLTGVFVGLGAATTFYPLLILVAVGIVCVRQRQLRELGKLAAAAAASWGLINLPILALYPQGWLATFGRWRERPLGPDTIYRVISEATGWLPSVTLMNALTIALLVSVIAAVGYAGLTAPRQPSLASLLFLLVAGLLLIGKEWRPESSLWLVPLAVLAVSNTRVVLAWMTFDALLWAPRMALFLDADRKWLPAELFYVTSALRWFLVAALCAYVVWDLVRPVGGVDDYYRFGNGPLGRSPLRRQSPVVHTGS